LIDDIIRVGLATETNVISLIRMLDEDDRKFYDVAKSAEAFLITGNIRHYPKEPFIVSPSGFLEICNNKSLVL